MLKKIFVYYSIILLLLLLIGWRISDTGLHESIIPGMENLSISVLKLIVAVLSILYVLVCYWQISRKFLAGDKRGGWIQLAASLFVVIMVVFCHFVL